MTKLASKLPEGGHGLSTVSHILVRNPHQKHVVIGVVDCSSVTTDNDSGAVEPTARIRRLEVIADAGDLNTAESLLRRALDVRLGSIVLPLAIEDDLTHAFVEAIGRLGPAEGFVDAETGEVVPIDREIREALGAVKRLGFGRAARILSIALAAVDDGNDQPTREPATGQGGQDTDDLVTAAEMVIGTQHGSASMIQTENAGRVRQGGRAHGRA